MLPSLSLALTFGVLAAFAAPEDDAKRAYELGETAYEVSQYADALEHFHAAYAAAKNIEDPALRDRVLVTLYFNLARTHVKVFRVDGDRDHLPQALDLLEKFDAATDDPEEAAAIAELRADIEALRASNADAKADAADTAASSRHASATDEADGTDSGTVVPPPAPGDDTRGSRPLLIGGVVALTAGVAGFGIMGAGMGMGGAAARGLGDGSLDDDVALSRGRTGNALTVAGAAVGGLGLAAGATLIILSTRKRSATASATPHAAPWLGTDGAGVVVGGSF